MGKPIDAKLRLSAAVGNLQLWNLVWLFADFAMASRGFDMEINHNYFY